ncbi:interleukin-18 receptor accessory protein-like [Liolophura sinensis]|uniref:interleukin-18 receptor accessory protein-like n=1 Tax=Liolophura sinensis TaxID=3198878 RepID=UPI0031586695
MPTARLPLAAVILTILDVAFSVPPRFYKRPEFPSLPIIVGHEVKLDCFLISGVNFTMTWTKNNRTIEKSSNIVFNYKNQELLIRRAVLADTGTYECKASNAEGSVHHKQFIKVKDERTSRPVVTDTLPPGGVAKVRLGTSLNISCTFSSDDSCLQQTMYWLKGGRYVNETDRITWLPSNGCEKGLQRLALSVVKVRRSDLGKYQCYGENQFGNDSREITLMEFIPTQQDLGRTKLIIIIGSVSGLGVVIVVTLVIYRVYRHKSKDYDHLEWEEPDLRHYEFPNYEMEFDAFISYSSDDEEWVKHILFKRLRNDGYNICVDFKDFTPGMPIAENIMDAIYKSKRTLIVMSEHFLKSMWGQFELQQAHNRAVAKKEDVIILMKLDNCKVPAKLMGKTFLDWADLNVKPHFWERLKDAIGRPGDFPKRQLVGNQGDDKEEPIENPDKKDVADVANIVIEPEEKMVETDRDLLDDPPDNKPEGQLIDPNLANVDQHVIVKKAARACRLQ